MNSSTYQHYSQQPKVEATQESMNGRMDKQNVVYTYNGTSVLKKEILTRHTMDEPYAE